MDIHTEKHWRPYCCYTIVLKQHMASYCDGNTWESMQSLNFCRSNFTTMTTVKFLWKFQQSSMKLLIKVRSLCKKTTKSSNLALTSDLSGNSLVLEIFRAPIELCVGILYGVLFGLLLWLLPTKLHVCDQWNIIWLILIVFAPSQTAGSRARNRFFLLFGLM